MNIKNITVKIQDKKSALAEFAKALTKARKGMPVRKEGISAQSIEALRSLITEKRLELLHTIKDKNPKSIYELAHVVSRDIKSVATDIEILKDLGFISLENTSDEHKRVKPHLLYEKINVEIML